MTKGRFAGKVVMITGAAGGFGAEAARRFGEEGASLLLSDIDNSGLWSISQELKKRNINLVAQDIDITSEKSLISHIQHGVDQLGEIDIGVNNAGIGQSLNPLSHTHSSDFDRIMNINAKGVFLCMKHQLPGMIARGSGAILNVASAAGLIGAGQMAAYAASKHAVVGLTRSAADEVARKGIRVNALCPSFAPTALFQDMADDIAERHDVSRNVANERITTRIPMRRLARIEEVVQAMLWACDDANSFMTGQAISIDGGLTAV